MNRSRFLASVLALLAAHPGCTLTSHPVSPSRLGIPGTTAALVAALDQPGPLRVETVVSADWAVDRGGILNLDHPRAKAAGLEDGEEPIQVYFHVVRHPLRGTFLIDTGVERALRDDPDRAAIRGVVADLMRDQIRFRAPPGEWLEGAGERLAGVLLTHLHLDHVAGLPDVPRGVPLYAGPGETRARSLQNLVVGPNVDRALQGHAPIQEWPFPQDAAATDEAFEGIVDVFGDGSLWALWVPGHTPGSTAYLARTEDGPVLFVGDACHTAWGWRNDVEPGTFTADRARNVDSLARLRRFVAAHPQIEVRLGHQPILAPAAP